MEFGEKLKELNMTGDEIDRFTKAFRDEKFKGMLLDYARELSDPDNKKKYEEEIKLLEQERGNDIDFIHVEPFRVLRTSMNGNQKCFINICGSEKIGKPEFKWGVTEDGRRGQHWSLPHSLTPGRPDRDPKGNKFMVYDVVFHPDSIHLASKDKRFMSMVANTAIQGIQESFTVSLDEKNTRELKIKYKGSPQPCVIRKPIPGFVQKEPSTQSDPLAFPYPGKNPATATTESTEAPRTKVNDTKPKTLHIQPQAPNYTLKYRSFIDLQDFRCSRDSGQSPRPKEIVVTVDMPLLKSARDANLEINNKTLLLESNRPAYRLELPLAYPVDEDKGEAKFNKQKGQLTITLPVLPSNETFNFSQTVSDCETEDKWNEQEKEGEKDEIAESEERDGEICDQAAQHKDVCGRVSQGDDAVHHIGMSTEEGNTEAVDGNINVKQPISNLSNDEDMAEQSSCIEDERRESSESDDSESNDFMKISEGNEETVVTAEKDASNGSLNKVETQASLMNQISSETQMAQMAVAVSATAQGPDHSIQTEDGSMSLVTEIREMPVEEEDVDEDDLPREQTFPSPDCNRKPPPTLLRETNEDGEETVISDHSTSAGITFQNSLLYELD